MSITALLCLCRKAVKGESNPAKDHHGTPNSELSLMLEAALTSGEPVIVETGERTYTLFVTLAEPARDTRVHYDPQAAIAGLRALDEALAGVDREQLLRDVYAQREQDSQGRLDENLTTQNR